MNSCSWQSLGEQSGVRSICSNSRTRSGSCSFLLSCAPRHPPPASPLLPWPAPPVPRRWPSHAEGAQVGGRVPPPPIPFLPLTLGQPFHRGDGGQGWGVDGTAASGAGGGQSSAECWSQGQAEGPAEPGEVAGGRARMAEWTRICWAPPLPPGPRMARGTDSLVLGSH